MKESITKAVKIYIYLRDHANERKNTKEIARALDLNPRTVTRYLGELLLIDYNIISELGRNGGYMYVE